MDYVKPKAAFFGGKVSYNSYEYFTKIALQGTYVFLFLEEEVQF